MDTALLVSFLVAADAGSLSAAATRLGVQVSTISRHVAELERTLGVTLFERTGRGVRPTAAGERYVDRARQAVHELELGAAEARGERAEPVSQLRMSSPLELSLRVLPDVLGALARAHPALRVDAYSDARRVSLLEEDYDVAIRMGELDTSLVARRVGAVSLVLCGTPEGALRVRSVSALEGAEHVLVAGSPAEVVASHRGRRVIIRPRGRMRVSSFSEAAALAVASGDPLVILPGYTAAPYLASGTLVRALPSLVLPRVAVHLVHAPRLRGAAVVRDLATLLAQALERSEGALAAAPRRNARGRRPSRGSPASSRDR